MSLQIRGLEDLQRKTKPRILYGPIRQFFDRARFMVERYAKENAPVDRGRLRQSIRSEVDQKPLPKWARVTDDVKAGGFPYPLALDEGGVRRTYHYRRGPFSGQETAGWFSERSFEDHQDEIGRFLRQAEADIRREWERG